MFACSLLEWNFTLCFEGVWLIYKGSAYIVWFYCVFHGSFTTSADSNTSSHLTNWMFTCSCTAIHGLRSFCWKLKILCISSSRWNLLSVKPPQTKDCILRNLNELIWNVRIYRGTCFVNQNSLCLTVQPCLLSYKFELALQHPAVNVLICVNLCLVWKYFYLIFFTVHSFVLYYDNCWKTPCFNLFFLILLRIPKHFNMHA